MTGKYATKTAVPISKTRDEIEKVLTKYGASAFAYGWDEGRASVQFVAHERLVRLTIQGARREDHMLTAQGWQRSENQIVANVEQEDRQKWRALLLVIKAKLEAVEAEIVTFEEEFFAHLVLPNGSTVYEDVQAPVEQAYLSGHVRLELGGPA